MELKTTVSYANGSIKKKLGGFKMKLIKKLSTIVLIIIMTVVVYPFAGMTVSATSTKDAIKTFNGHSYEVFDFGRTWTWDEAKAYCESLGGHLATITTQAEQNFVFGLISKAARKYYFLGGYRKNNTWNWVTKEAFKYTNWAPGEPSDSNEQYLMMYKSDDAVGGRVPGKWNDTSGGDNYGIENYGFVCEWDYTFSIFNGHKYKVFDSGMTWNEAKAYCESIGGHLVTITTKAEQNFVFSLVSKAARKYYFLGGFRGDNTWNWVTKEEFKYTNWAPGEPSDINEQYLMMYRSDDAVGGRAPGKWNDVLGDTGYGSKSYGFVCEWESVISAMCVPLN